MPMLRQQYVPQRRQARIDRVEKPELRHLPCRHPGLKLFSRLLLLCYNRALLFQNLNQPLQHRCKALTGADTQTGRNKSCVVDEMARLVSHDSCDREGEQVLVGRRQNHQPNILAANLHRFRLKPGVLVVHHLGRAEKARIPARKWIQITVLLSLHPSRNRERDRQTVSSREELLDDVIWIRPWIRLRNIKRESILKHSARGQESDRTVAQRVRIQLARR